MLAPKASGRATESVKAPRGIDQLGGRIDHEATTPAKLGAQAPDREAIPPDVTGFSAVLAEWARAEMKAPANQETGRPSSEALRSARAHRDSPERKAHIRVGGLPTK